MDTKQGLFNAIRLLAFTIIVAELGTIKRILFPESFFEYLHMSASIELYIQHIVLSIVFWCLGALIFLKRA